MTFFKWLSHLGQQTPPAHPERWVVLDVETSGLDLGTAQLLAIAAIAVKVDWTQGKLTITPGDSFEVDICPFEVVKDKRNILVHGIGQHRQLQGQALPQALTSFLAFLGDAKLLAFHAWFDRTLITRHLKLAQLPGWERGLPNPWIDIEKLCAAAYPKIHAHSLDEWMNELSISCAARHEAAADSFAEAEVLQRIWPCLAPHAQSWKDLLRIEKQGRWLTQNRS